MMLQRFVVVTPEFPYTEWVCPEGGPTYDIRDVIEIEAETSRDAVILGVHQMLRSHDYSRGWCQSQRLDNLCPFEGVKAEPFSLEPRGE